MVYEVKVKSLLAEAMQKSKPIGHINWEFAVKDEVHCIASKRNGIITGLRYTVGVQSTVKEYLTCYSLNDKTEFEWELAGWLEKGHQTIID